MNNIKTTFWGQIDDLCLEGDIQCCGIDELTGITCVKTPDVVLAYLVEHVFSTDDDVRAVIWTDSPLLPFVIFSDNVKDHKYGEGIVALIRKKRLGKVHVTKTRVNPTGSTTLRAYLFEPDWKRMFQWYANHPRTKEGAK